MKRMSGAYQVDDDYNVHIWEVAGGFRYSCVDEKEDSHIADGFVSWQELEEIPAASALACARLAVIQEIGLEGEKIFSVSDARMKRVPD